MRSRDVKIKGTYDVKVSGSIQPVRVDRVNPLGGWDCTNLRTGRSIRVRSGQRFRRETTPVALPVADTKREARLLRAVEEVASLTGRAAFPYVVTEVDLAGTEVEFVFCRDPFTAGKVEFWLAGSIGRWGTARVLMHDRYDEHFSEDAEGERFFEGLSDAGVAAFVRQHGVVTRGLTREQMLGEFYVSFYDRSYFLGLARAMPSPVLT